MKEYKIGDTFCLEDGTRLEAQIKILEEIN